MSRDPRLRIRGGLEEGLKALRAPSERQFSQLPGMSVLRPLDKLPGLNTATILVGVSSPDYRAHLSSWAAPQQPDLLRLSEILAWAAPAGVWWAGEPLSEPIRVSGLLGSLHQ